MIDIETVMTDTVLALTDQMRRYVMASIGNHAEVAKAAKAAAHKTTDDMFADLDRYIETTRTSDPMNSIEHTPETVSVVLSRDGAADQVIGAG